MVTWLNYFWMDWKYIARKFYTVQYDICGQIDVMLVDYHQSDSVPTILDQFDNKKEAHESLVPKRQMRYLETSRGEVYRSLRTN